MGEGKERLLLKRRRVTSIAGDGQKNKEILAKQT